MQKNSNKTTQEGGSMERGRQMILRMRMGWSKMAIFASFAHYYLLNLNI